MVELEATRGVLAPLANVGLKQRLSMFAYDVMLFIKPNETDLQACAFLLQAFDEASGLRVNLAKSKALPIRCNSEIMQRVEELLGCTMGTYPCKYLGLPLTIRKQSAAQLAGLVDQLAGNLPRWKAANMPKSERLILVQSVLCVIPIHAMMALDIPMKTISAMTKICRSFLWCAKEQANGGQCMVSWDAICASKLAGDLGIPNLRWMNIALQARWPWLQRADRRRPWADFDITVPEESSQLFRVVACSTVGDGRTTLFWEDR